MDESMVPSNRTLSVSISIEELTFICNAINETLEAVEDFEFHTRTGETRKRAMEIRMRLLDILDHAAGKKDR